MKMTFKQYLDQSQSLSEEIIQGGVSKMFKHLSYWFDRGPENAAKRIAKLEQEIINAGGVAKFAMIVRRIPSVRHFLLAHKDELDGDLAELVKLL